MEFKYTTQTYKWIPALPKSVEDSERFSSETHLSSFQIIGDELLRNLGLTICAVAIVTLILIQNLQTSFWVLCCVIFTVVDVVGSMYWLGLTIEISTSIMILLCAGLAVDYSAHIGNEFTRLQGTKDGTLSDYKLRFFYSTHFTKGSCSFHTKYNNISSLYISHIFCTPCDNYTYMCINVLFQNNYNMKWAIEGYSVCPHVVAPNVLNLLWLSLIFSSPFF
jgi:hypothetical protein